MNRIAAETFLKSCAGRKFFSTFGRKNFCPRNEKNGNIELFSNCLIFRIQPQARCFYSIPKKEKESYGTLVYSGPVNKRVRFIKNFSVSTSVLAILLQPYFLNEYLLGVDAHSTSLAAYLALVGATGLMFITPIMLHYCKNFKISPKVQNLIQFF